jgi:predicted GIY-YIG superfamily endonuclease
MPNYIIYVLTNTNNNNTYIGITNNQARRIRQHNGELVGGAKTTTAKKGDGQWIYYGWIRTINEDLIDKHTALSLEKRIKIRSRKMKGKLPIDRRMNAIQSLLVEYEELYFYKNEINEQVDENINNIV